MQHFTLPQELQKHDTHTTESGTLGAADTDRAPDRAADGDDGPQTLPIEKKYPIFFSLAFNSK